MNPLKEIRESQNLTIEKITALSGFSENGRRTVIRAEQGLFTNPPPRLLETLVDIDPELRTADEITERYHSWVGWQRRQSSAKIVRAVHWFAEQNWEIDDPRHPFIVFLDTAFPGSTRSFWSKALCVHPFTLVRYIECRTPTMPSQIQVALSDVGLTDKEIHDLITLGNIYYNEH